jgi:hypothetical protein
MGHANELSADPTMGAKIFFWFRRRLTIVVGQQHSFVDSGHLTVFAVEYASMTLKCHLIVCARIAAT